MKILGIGATGGIGSYVVRRLVALGHDVTVYHRGEHEPPLPELVTHVRSEHAAIPILSFPETIRRLEFDAVIHMVPLGWEDTSVAVSAFRGRTSRFVLVSSADVYRAYGQLIGTETADLEQHPFLLDESAPLREILYPYGRSAPGPWGTLVDYDKILAERAACETPDLTSTILRLPKVYGPGDRQRTFADFIGRMTQDRHDLLIGDSYAAWRWTHGYIEDVADAIALAAIHPNAAGQTFNVGELVTPTMYERVQRLADAAGWRGSITIVPDVELPEYLQLPFTPAIDLATDTSRIRRELSFSESVDSDEALARTVAWIQFQHESLQPGAAQ